MVLPIKKKINYNLTSETARKSQNTNLSAEFWVLSLLHRLDINATLTLGNKKSVDIVIDLGKDIKTIDVKGISKGSGSFPVDNWVKKPNHFYVFVAFNNIDEIPD